MAHFAKLGKGNIVLAVHVVNNKVITDDNGQEQEQLGIDFLNNLYNTPNHIWKQTSYNGNFRKNYAGINWTYDETRDAFIPPKVYPSWIIDEDTCLWKAPIDKPITYEDSEVREDGTPIPDKYIWNEIYCRWDKFNNG
jgi:hypothetical protein